MVPALAPPTLQAEVVPAKKEIDVELPCKGADAVELPEKSASAAMSMASVSMSDIATGRAETDSVDEPTAH